MAAEAAHEAVDAAHGAAEHGAASFPPFDASLFPHQLFWFAVSFIALYYVMSRMALPKVAEVIAARAKTVKTDLDAAAAASNAADEARKAADAAAEAGRSKARAAVDAARAEAAAELAAEQAKVEKRLSDRAAVAEKRIAETRQKALAEVGPIANDLAKDIVARVTGGAVGMAP
jgi:F-type H+-transporting ATPase subunit b